jgi:hypothetical protein
MGSRRRSGPEVAIPVFIAFMGAAALSNEISSPRFGAFYAIDVVRLIASGMCFGAAIAALLIFFAGPRPG